ncbi:uncharacterized protein ACA1_073110, partial [Acanthamoeba castellanii str. Neff]
WILRSTQAAAAVATTEHGGGALHCQGGLQPARTTTVQHHAGRSVWAPCWLGRCCNSPVSWLIRLLYGRLRPGARPCCLPIPREAHQAATEDCKTREQPLLLLAVHQDRSTDPTLVLEHGSTHHWHTLLAVLLFYPNWNPASQLCDGGGWADAAGDHIIARCAHSLDCCQAGPARLSCSSPCPPCPKEESNQVELNIQTQGAL